MGFSYNISFSIAAAVLILTLILVVTVHYSATNIVNKRFRLFLYGALAMIALDIATVATNDHASNFPSWFNYFLNGLYFFSGALVALFFLYYCISYALKDASPQKRKKFYIINLSILGAYALTLLLNGFFGFYFFFDSTNGYSHGPVYIMVNALSIFYLVESAAVFIAHKRNFNRRQIISIVVFYTVFLVSFVLQLTAFPGVLLSDFGTAVGALFVFFSIETPDYAKLISTLDELNELKASLEIQVASRTEELKEEKHSYEALTLETLSSLARVIDAKDHYTVGHSFRVASYSKGIGEELGIKGSALEKLYFAGLIHDVGKIGIKEEILTKPGKLTNAEFEAIKAHSALGGDILKGIREFPVFEAVARSHHERYDGTGYPDKKAGENIPFEARIVSIADSYDAMTSDRSYRRALSDEVALKEIRENSGTQFDPQMVEAFIRLCSRFPDSLRNHYKELAEDITHNRDE